MGYLDPRAGRPSTVFGNELYVDTVNGADGNAGTSWSSAFKTMTAALAGATDQGVISVVGDVREQCVAPLGVYGVKIIGAAGGQPHHDNAMRWRAPASPVAQTALLRLREQGWEVHNILFVPSADNAAIELHRAEDATNPDASHAIIKNCVFTGDGTGAVGIEDIGGMHHVLIEGCEFRLLVGTGGVAGVAAGILTRSTGIAVPLRNVVRNCWFTGNTNDIIVSSSYGLFEGNRHGSVAATNIVSTTYVSTQGGYNVVVGNVFPDAIADIDPAHGYTGAATDVWTGNLVSDQAAFAYGQPA